MKTPKEFRANLDAGIITATMLSAALYSINKHAKNYRDRERLADNLYGRGSKNAKLKRNKKMRFYEKKEKLLSILSPICVHQEFAGYKHKRIYDYDPHYEREFFSAWINGLVVLTNSYVERETLCKVSFFDRILLKKPQYRYYLYYCVGNQTFHSPIDCAEQYPDLPVKKIGTIVTKGEKARELLSIEFVDKMLHLIESGNYQYQEDIPTEPPAYPETEIQFAPKKPDWKDVWDYISGNLVGSCKIKLVPELSAALKSSFCLEKDIFRLNQQKDYSMSNKTGIIFYKEPFIGAVKVKLNTPLCMTPELEAYLNALDTRNISCQEYAQYLTEAESPIHDYLVDFTKEHLRRENTKNCLRVIANQLYEKEPRKIELDEVWEIFMERYGNANELLPVNVAATI